MQVSAVGFTTTAPPSAHIVPMLFGRTESSLAKSVVEALKYDYGTGVLDGIGVRDETGVFVGRKVGDGGTVFVGVGDGSAVGVIISSAR